MLAALLGAVVGGMASLLAGIVVDRQRLRRETRVRIYDDHMPQVQTSLEELRDRSRRGVVYTDYHAVLTNLAQIRRAMFIVGTEDRKRAARWASAYHALVALESRLINDAGGPTQFSGAERKAALSEVATHTENVIEELKSYQKWLEDRLDKHFA